MENLHQIMFSIFLSILSNNDCYSRYCWLSLSGFNIIFICSSVANISTNYPIILFSLHLIYLSSVLSIIAEILDCLLRTIIYLNTHYLIQLLFFTYAIFVLINKNKNIEIYRLFSKSYFRSSIIKHYLNYPLRLLDQLIFAHLILQRNPYSLIIIQNINTHRKNITNWIVRKGFEWYFGKCFQSKTIGNLYKSSSSHQGIKMSKTALENKNLDAVDLEDIDDLDNSSDDELEEVVEIPKEQIEEAEKLDKRITGKDRQELTIEEKRAALRRSIAEKRNFRSSRGGNSRMGRRAISKQVSDMISDPDIDNAMKSVLENDNLDKLLELSSKTGMNASQIRQALKKARK